MLEINLKQHIFHDEAPLCCNTRRSAEQGDLPFDRHNKIIDGDLKTMDFRQHKRRETKQNKDIFKIKKNGLS